MPFTFEDKIDIIDAQINKRKSRWQLKAVPSIDFEDISQLLRIHIFKQWDKWDQTRKLEPWLNAIIHNQMFNFMRNFYGNYARPCVAGENGSPCPANQGSNGDVGLCSIYGKQCNDCPLYAYWEKNKKAAHDTKLPLPLESHYQEVYDIPERNQDISIQLEQLTQKLKESLTPIQFKVYILLFMEGKTENQTAKILGYRNSKNSENAGIKTITNISKIIIEKSKKIIEEEL